MLIFKRTELLDKERLYGKWQLVKIAGKDPREFKIAECVIEFHTDGNWRSFLSILGEWDSLKTESTASWHLAEDRIRFDFGNKQAESGVKLQGDTLLLFDDPVISVRSNTSVQFRYTRLLS